MNGDERLDDNRMADRTAGAASPDDLVGAYLLDALDPAERAEFEEFLLESDSSAADRAGIALLRPVVDVLSLALAETEEDVAAAPSPDLRSRILQAARDDERQRIDASTEVVSSRPATPAQFRTTATPTAPPTRRSNMPEKPGGMLAFARRVGIERLAAGFLALVAAGAIIWGITLQNRLANTEDDLDSVRDELALEQGDGEGVVQAVVYALNPTEDGPPDANAIVSLQAEDSTDATISATGLPPVEAGRAYQLWFIDLDDAGNVAGSPRPSITFQPGADGVATITGVPVDAPFDAVAISNEPESGSTVPSTVLMLGTRGVAAG